MSKSGWITDGYIAQMAIDSCDGNHLKRGSEMNPFDLFCIERSVFVFYLDGELNHDG